MSYMCIWHAFCLYKDVHLKKTKNGGYHVTNNV